MVNEKNSPPMDEKSAVILQLFQNLDKNRKKTALYVAMLMVHCPGFMEAMKEATPEGEVAPSWETTERLVAEWRREEKSL